MFLLYMYNTIQSGQFTIIYIQVHIEIELYALFVLFAYTFCVAISCIPISSQ